MRSWTSGGRFWNSKGTTDSSLWILSSLCRATQTATLSRKEAGILVKRRSAKRDKDVRRIFKGVVNVGKRSAKSSRLKVGEQARSSVKVEREKEKRRESS